MSLGIGGGEAATQRRSLASRARAFELAKRRSQPASDPPAAAPAASSTELAAKRRSLFSPSSPIAAPAKAERGKFNVSAGFMPQSAPQATKDAALSLGAEGAEGIEGTEITAGTATADRGAAVPVAVAASLAADSTPGYTALGPGSLAPRGSAQLGALPALAGPADQAVPGERGALPALGGAKDGNRAASPTGRPKRRSSKSGSKSRRGDTGGASTRRASSEAARANPGGGASTGSPGGGRANPLDRPVLGGGAGSRNMNVAPDE